MRVLVLHNRYSSGTPSGENNLVDIEVAALRAAGVDVETLLPSSDEIAKMSISGKVGAALSPVFGLSKGNELNALLRSFRPDVVSIHNPYPLISPTAISACSRVGVPVVATINNFRLRCINGLFYRDGHICTDCEGRRVALPGLVHGCYRDSHIQSAIMTTAVARHRPTWAGVARYVAVSNFVADRLMAWGEPADKVVVKPNFVEDPGELSPLGEGFLYAGRLAQEKGIMLLLDAWEISGLGATTRLVVVGDGPLRAAVEHRSLSLSGVQLTGSLVPSDVEQHRRATAVTVYASLWFEAHPAIAESFAHGHPVVTTDVGALGTLVDDEVGWRAAPNAASLAAALVQANNRNEQQLRGAAARKRYLERYRSEVVLSTLLGIYEGVMR